MTPIQFCRKISPSKWKRDFEEALTILDETREAKVRNEHLRRLEGILRQQSKPSSFLKVSIPIAAMESGRLSLVNGSRLEKFHGN